MWLSDLMKVRLHNVPAKNRNVRMTVEEYVHLINSVERLEDENQNLRRLLPGGQPKGDKP
jgi:cell shape-determining protein MreC